MLDLKARLGLRIKTFRSRRGLTQEGLAEAIGVTVESISNIERGRSAPRLTTLEAICRSLRIQPADLFAEPTRPRRTRVAIELEARLIDLAHALSEADLAVAVKQLEALAGRTAR